MTVIEVKTADLIGPALDWAVARAEGYTAHLGIDGNIYSSPAAWIRDSRYCAPGVGIIWKPSTEWSQGGPLIEKYHVQIAPVRKQWLAMHEAGDFRADSPLVAACRAVVSAKLGDTVQVPELMP